MGFFDKLLNRPPKSAVNLGRNSPCWCGSGKKYKRCHYASDQKHFNAKIMDAACKTSG